MQFSTSDEAIWCCQVVSQQTALAAACFACEEDPHAPAEFVARVAEENEQQVQSELLRCIFGPNPFLSFPQLNPSWLKSDVVKLAKTSYQHRTEPDFILSATGYLG
jgi:hypothetical protein